MLKLVDYNSERIVVTYTDCNSINKDRVASVKITSPVTSNSSYTILELLGSEAVDFLNSTQRIIEYYNLDLEDINKFTLLVYLNGKYNITSFSLNSNVIEGNQILSDFVDSNFILIGTKEYEIDKSRSSKNKLTLFFPLEEAPISNSYKVVIREEQSLFPLNFLLDRAETNISSIVHSNCCTKDIENQFLYTLKFTSLQRAIRDNDKASAEILFKYLAANEYMPT